MLNLTLREEFRGRRLQGTQIELPTAVTLPAARFLEIVDPDDADPDGDAWVGLYHPRIS